MFKQTQLTKSVALAITGIALTAGSMSSASASTTMYNKYISSGTDGWVWGGQNISTPEISNSALANPGFVGTNDSNNDGYGDTPFGYIGASFLNWGAELTHAGDSLEISQADSQSRYGFAADIDTGAGAWQDAGATSLGIIGWAHQTDIGIISVVEDMLISITASVVNGNVLDNFGMTLFDGMDTSSGLIFHHQAWNEGTASTIDNPFHTTGVNYMQYDDSVDSTNAFTFNAEAGKVYSLYLGGKGVGSWSTNTENYKLNITTSAVPIPAAIWLMGSGILGLASMSRRKTS